MTCRMELDRLVTLTPWRRTSSGRRDRTACTRLFTSMVAWSGSVPISKVTVSVSEPLLEAEERM